MLLIVLGILAAVALVVFLVYRNLKDEKKFEREIDEKDEHRIRHYKEGEQ